MIKLECVLHLPRKLVADHLDINLITHAEPDGAHEVLVNPWLKLAHPAKGIRRAQLDMKVLTTHQSVVFSPDCGPGPLGGPPACAN